MGKRKERRQAAMNAVGRRVKLDLFAESSGDLVGSSQDGVRGEIDSNNHAELPNSPSSSGHQLENPLMLLEQYSDDELVVHDEQGKVSFREEKKDGKGFISSAPMKDKDEEKDSASEIILQIAEKCGHKESDVVYPVESLKENDETSESTTLDGVISGWKVLLHEESNQYYYWNVSTGETSWEVPCILIPTIDIGNDEKATYDIDVDNANFKTSEYHANGNIQLKDYNPGETCDGSNDTHEYKMVNKEYNFKALHGKGVDGDADLKDMKNMAGQLESNIGISFLASDSIKHSGDSLSNHLSKSGEDAEKLGDVPSAEEIEVQADFSSNLVEQCKSLLHKLKAMQWSQKCVQGHDQISKYMVEVETRLVDIMSLACNGFSLLPFWVHSEKRLKLLEAAIDEMPVLSNSLHSCDADDLHTSHHETTDEAKVHANENIAIHRSCREVYAAEYAGSLESRKNAYAEALNGVATNNFGRNALEEGEVVEHAAHEELSPETVHLGEEDMELDMEVEDVPLDSSIVDASFGHNRIDHGRDMVQALPSNEGPSFLDYASSVPPPPPDEDWVPPSSSP
ncbi:hypothetical protein DM860_017662 [Cuscuta australis]|uniref:WW domain-containing protein n=1 Tax=Cuscuta australis TaxID=267555 RepID=A0A328E1R4_9ASTE|nr:hypothetical protein DM860_017662 [Cuscuta australis]